MVLAAVFAVGTALAAPVQRPATAAGTMYRGAVTNQDWGRPVAAGDLDGDGYDDVVVAASESYGGYISRVYVMRGGPGAHGRGVIDLFSVSADQVILGAAVDDNLGSSMAIGDVNGDGYADLLLCASNASYGGLAYRGIAYVLFGGPQFFDLAVRDLANTANWNMRILGPVAGGDMGGSNLFGGIDAHAAAIGHVRNAAYGDIILGVHLADGGASQSGRVYIIFGGPFPSGYTLNLATTYGVRIDGRGEYDELGTVVLTGDLTGDGLADLILGNQYASKGLFTSEGAVHIFRGRALWGNYYRLNTAPADITLWGGRPQDELGAAAAVGDFNGDGVMDLATGAPGADAGTYDPQQGEGFVYGLLGSRTYQVGTHTIEYATATPAFVMIGEFQEGLGMQVSAADFDGDGRDDIAAAEWFAGPATNGVVEVVFGRNFAPGATFTANINTDLRIMGAANDRIGFAMAASDVNHDGLHEILFGTPFNNNDRGTAYVFTYVSGDSDHDGDRDLVDFADFQSCFTGPPTKALQGGCALFDFNLDESVDLTDLVAFAPLMTGPSAHTP